MSRSFQRLIPLCFLLLCAAASVSAAPLHQENTEIFLPVAFVDWPGKWIGPEGGSIVALAYHPTNPQIVYAGSWGAGVYKSLDGGKTWTTVNTGLDNLLIQSLAVNPGNPEIIYAGTYKSKLYKSINGGQSWFQSSNGIQDEAIIYSIAVDPWDTDNVYISTRGISNNGAPPWNGVVYRSINNGTTWIPSLKDVGGSSAQDWAYSLAIHANRPRIICAATHEHGPYCSQDEGLTWKAQTYGITDLAGRAILIDPSNTDPFTMYFGVWHGAGLFKSVDSGKTWTIANKNLNGAKVYSFAFNPKQPATLFLGTFSVGIYKTLNYAKEWSSSGLPSKGIFALADAPNDPAILLAGVMLDGVYQSTDGGQNWQLSNTNLFSTSISSIFQMPGIPTRIFAATLGNGVYISENRGKTWQALNTGLPDAFVHQILVSPGAPETLFALTDTAGLYSMNINTLSGWIPVVTGIPDQTLANRNQAQSAFPPILPDGFELPQPDLNAVPLMNLAFSPAASQTAYLATAGAGVHRSQNGGQTWSPAGLSGKSIQSLAPSPLSSLTVAAAVLDSAQIQVTQNGGESWSAQSLSVNAVNTLVYPPSTDTGLLAGTDKGVWRQKWDHNWECLGLSGENIQSIVLSATNPFLIMAGSDHGFFYSLDGGVSWVNGPAELAPYPVVAISENSASPGPVLLGTRSHGIFIFSAMPTH